jgi:triacylglycerol lipase
MTALTSVLLLLAMTTLLLVPESAPAAPTETISSRDCVVLLHGLGRTSLSMKGVEWYLKRRGYLVINARYPTSRISVEQISQRYLEPLLASHIPRSAAKINFVTHSQGGILLRHYLSEHDLPNLGRVVMLAPPNHGSEIIDRLKTTRLTRPFLGPSYLELGTDAEALPNRLGPVNFDCGIIAGDRSLNPLLSGMLTGPNDGKVTVASAQIEGMRDFLVLPFSHTWLMWRKTTLRQIQCFLETGRFEGITSSGCSVTRAADTKHRP